MRDAFAAAAEESRLELRVVPTSAWCRQRSAAAGARAVQSGVQRPALHRQRRRGGRLSPQRRPAAPRGLGHGQRHSGEQAR
ncbi:MAG: hypothetical protein MZW92_76945 [Comamonadaceae bacterium]|nr:hypothetical protein [Comamonadaceae bacterium]